MDNLLDYFVGLCCARNRKDGLNSGSDLDTFPEGIRGSIAVESVRSEAISHPEKEGYLTFIDTSKGTEKQMYFVLKGDLYFFEQKDDYIPIGVSILHSSRMVPEVESCTTKFSQFCFRIIFPGECIFKMQSNEELQKWKVSFLKSIESNGVSDEILEQGYLNCLGTKGTWDKHWVVLRRGVLAYFSSPQETIPIISIPLTLEYTKPDPAVLIPKEKGNILSLFYCSTITVMTENFEEQQSWVSTISAAISSQEIDKTTMKKFPVGWKRPGKVKEVISPLIDILRDPLRVEFFRLFTVELECEHYLLFWLEVQQFRRLCKKEDKAYLRLFGKAICNKYVQIQHDFDADFVETRDRALSSLEDPNVNIFRDSQLFVYQILRDIYPLFVTSSYAEQMAKAVVNND
eukprot:c18281_g1_i4.p1 GENE.c18281_g1_i4~~c18281_g1_i4.p1  ORF type:complete len:402 (-),score=122.76 c18281_g1_i4:29-1234(-)